MKQFHTPTLIMHMLLLALARLTISDYHDFFLICSILVLIVHFIWACCSSRSFYGAHCLGAALHFLAEPLGLISTGSGFYGLGSGFCWLFHCVALAVSFLLHTILFIVRLLKTK